MNSLVLISPLKGSGFKPILSGKSGELLMSAGRQFILHEDVNCPKGMWLSGIFILYQSPTS